MTRYVRYLDEASEGRLATENIGGDFSRNDRNANAKFDAWSRECIAVQLRATGCIDFREQ